MGPGGLLLLLAEVNGPCTREITVQTQRSTELEEEILSTVVLRLHASECGNIRIMEQLRYRAT